MLSKFGPLAAYLCDGQCSLTIEFIQLRKLSAVKSCTSLGPTYHDERYRTDQVRTIGKKTSVSHLRVCMSTVGSREQLETELLAFSNCRYSEFSSAIPVRFAIRLITT